VGFGPWEIFIVLVILVVIFGAGRLTHLGGAFGRSVREFRSAAQEYPTAPAVPTVPPVACPSCATLNPASNKFCSSCGAVISPPAAITEAEAAAPEVTCPSCATVNPPSQAFCGQCGTRLSQPD
jgi:sec-independent protein translocase protein TatA